MKYFIKMLETIDNKQKTYLNSESASVLRYVFFYCKYCGRGFYGGDGAFRLLFTFTVYFTMIFINRLRLFIVQ